MPHKRPGIDWLQIPNFAKRKVLKHSFSFQTDKYSAIAQTHKIYNTTVRQFCIDGSVQKLARFLWWLLQGEPSPFLPICIWMVSILLLSLREILKQEKFPQVLSLCTSENTSKHTLHLNVLSTVQGPTTFFLHILLPLCSFYWILNI